MSDQETGSSELMTEIYRAIINALESKMHLIGSVIDGEARREIRTQKIIDKGDFLANAGYTVESDAHGMNLHVGSNVTHAPFVLGGKVPSGMPMEPLIEWVERKKLAWVDKKSGEALKVEEIAKLIWWKIKKKGIAARNVYETVLQNKEAWIYEQFNSIEVRI